MEAEFVPGRWVRHPGRPDWGRGQVQSAIDGRITVNFEEAGKQTLLVPAVPLELIDPEDGSRP